MKIEKIDHVHILVKDLGKAIKFWAPNLSDQSTMAIIGMRLTMPVWNYYPRYHQTPFGRKKWRKCREEKDCTLFR